MIIGILAAAAISFTGADAEFAHSFASNLVAQCTPRDAGTVRGKLAANWILDSVSAQGADIRRDRFHAKTPKGEREFTNLYCMFHASTNAGWVVLMSHFDTKPGTSCPGANDGASTCGLLAAFAASFSERCRPEGNVILLWTDGEECMERYCARDGLWGSKRAVESVAARKLKVKAVICLDMIGDRDLKIGIPKNTSTALRGIATRVAKTAGFRGVVCEMDELVKDDHVPFLEAGYPSLLLIDFSYGGKPGSNEYWHTSEDTMDKISKKSLAVSGRYAAALLEELAR